MYELKARRYVYTPALISFSISLHHFGTCNLLFLFFSFHIITRKVASKRDARACFSFFIAIFPVTLAHSHVSRDVYNSSRFELFALLFFLSISLTAFRTFCHFINVISFDDNIFVDVRHLFYPFLLRIVQRHRNTTLNMNAYIFLHSSLTQHKYYMWYEYVREKKEKARKKNMSAPLYSYYILGRTTLMTSGKRNIWETCAMNKPTESMSKSNLFAVLMASDTKYQLHRIQKDKWKLPTQQFSIDSVKCI